MNESGIRDRGVVESKHLELRQSLQVDQHGVIYPISAELDPSDVEEEVLAE